MATSVIEVGIDVPNATVMLIEAAERYGLSQLHQLRGRVGRGEHESLCILFGDPKLPRLEAIATESDGFRLAEVDLELRGAGDVLGTRQHGLPVFRVARLPEDLPLLVRARDRAEAMLARDPGLTEPEHALLRDAVVAASARSSTRSPHERLGGLRQHRVHGAGEVVAVVAAEGLGPLHHGGPDLRLFVLRRRGDRGGQRSHRGRDPAPQGIVVGDVVVDLDVADLGGRKPRRAERGLDLGAVAQGEVPGAVRVGRRHVPALDQHAARNEGPRVAHRSAQTANTSRPSPRSTRRVSLSAASRSDISM